MSNNFVGLLLNSFSDIVFELQKYYITFETYMNKLPDKNWIQLAQKPICLTCWMSALTTRPQVPLLPINALDSQELNITS